eukprot:2129836-Rhodomonas_salina.1
MYPAPVLMRASLVLQCARGTPCAVRNATCAVLGVQCAVLGVQCVILRSGAVLPGLEAGAQRRGRCP